MATPTQSRPVQDKLLEDASLQLIYDEGQYIAGKLFTPRESKNNTGKFAVNGKEHLRVEADLVGGKVKYANVTTNDRDALLYSIEKHGLAGIITEEDFDNTEQPFDARLDETNNLTTKLMLGREQAMAVVVNDPANYDGGSNTATPVLTWDDPLSDPASDTNAARTAIKNSSGMAPDLAVLSWEVLQELRQHTQVLSRFVNAVSGVEGASDAQVMQFLNVKRMEIGFVSFNSAAEGQFDLLEPVWGKNLSYMVSPERAIKRQVTFGYTFLLNSIGKGTRVNRGPVTNPPNAEELLVDLAYGDFVVDSGKAGFLLEDVIA